MKMTYYNSAHLSDAVVRPSNGSIGHIQDLPLFGHDLKWTHDHYKPLLHAWSYITEISP